MPDIKKWNGSAWVDAENKRWDGSNWVDAYTYKWDGSNWIQIYPATFTYKTVNLNLTGNQKLNITTGELEYQNWYEKYHTTADKIEVKPNTEYSFSYTITTLCEYDKNGVYLNKYTDSIIRKPFTVSSDTYFIRVFTIVDPGSNVTITGLLK